MRLLTLILLFLLGGLQYDLWLGKNGLSDYHELSDAISRQQQDNLVLKDRNNLIYREIDDLTSGLEAIEEAVTEGEPVAIAPEDAPEAAETEPEQAQDEPTA